MFMIFVAGGTNKEFFFKLILVVLCIGFETPKDVHYLFYMWYKQGGDSNQSLCSLY